MALVESFVRFARRTGALVCAEGIETLDEIAALADLDVEWGQGYALGRASEPWAKVPVHAARRLPRGAGRGDAARSRGAGDDRRRRPRAGADQRPLRRHPYQAGPGGRAGPVWRPRSTPTHSRSRACTPRKGCWRPSPRPRKEHRTLFDLSEYPLTVRVLRTQEAVQVMIGDPETEPAEVDYLLELGLRLAADGPRRLRGREHRRCWRPTASQERPWTRTEINRARIIANQFASVLPGAAPSAPEPRLALTRMRRASGAPSACSDARDPDRDRALERLAAGHPMPAPGRIPRESR